MKKIFTLFLLVTSLMIVAQVPSYYNNVNLNQTGAALKNALATKIISTHTNNLSYTPGVWEALKKTDVDPNNPSKVLLLYGYSDTDGNYKSDRTRSKYANGGSAGSQWNREHTYAKSLGSPNLGTSGPGADAHHLRACDIAWNSTRSSRKFVAGSGNSGPRGSGWYPGDEWKGDVARMMMYMYLRYGNQCLPTGVANGSTVGSDSNMVQIFLQWNAEDPVSEYEKQRNPILQNLQGNRNPFIDNPAFATQIWGGPQAQDLFGNGGGNTGDTQAPTTPTNLTASNITKNSVNLSWSASTDNTAVTEYRVYRGTTQIGISTTTNFYVSGLTASTSYTFYVKAYDAAGNTSSNSNSASVTTLSDGNSGGGNTGGGNGKTTDLLISEYVEGSSYNKAIEIANFTGSSVNLSNYSLKKVTNGSGSFTSTTSLSGTLANGQVYVVAHSNASSSITSKANKTTSSGAINFNGNDAIGLFKNDVLIDIVGNKNSSSYFAKDRTLQRKSSVTSPNTSYVTSEWTVLSKNTFSGLGSHTVSGGSSNVDTTAPTVPTNVIASKITQTSVSLNWNAATDNTAVTGYDVYQNNNKIASVTSTGYSVSGLSANTTYSFYVKAKDASGNISAKSNTISVTTLSNTVSYCSSKGRNANYEYIDNVVLGGISNATRTNGGYGNFTSQTGNIRYGNNTIVVSAGFSSSSYRESWKVWIDFNQNGTFESTEQVVSGSSSGSGNLSYTFNVPTSAKAGATRMRVSMKWNGAPTACETFSYGEVEDYTVNIGVAARRATSNTLLKIDEELGNETPIFSAKVYPNPAVNFISINLRDDREVSFRITDYSGQMVKQGDIDRNIDVSDLQAGMYIIEMNDGQHIFTKKFVKK